MENAVLNSRPTMVKTSITYGLLIGVLLILILLIFYLLGEMTNVWATYVSYAVMFGGIILVTLARRNEELGGFITYSQALGLGTLTIFFSSLAVGIYVYIFYAFIDPAAINLLIEAAEIAILESTPNISDERVRQCIEHFASIHEARHHGYLNHCQLHLPGLRYVVDHLHFFEEKKSGNFLIRKAQVMVLQESN